MQTTLHPRRTWPRLLVACCMATSAVAVPSGWLRADSPRSDAARSGDAAQAGAGFRPVREPLTGGQPESHAWSAAPRRFDAVQEHAACPPASLGSPLPLASPRPLPPATAQPAVSGKQRSVAQQVSAEILGTRGGSETVPPQPDVATITSRRLAEQAAGSLQQAGQQAARGTLLTAQNSAYETLRLIADANDLLQGSVEAATNLQQARTALRECEDFAGRFGPVGADAISRMVQSHQTPVLKGCDTDALNGSRATDIYLDFARAKLAAVAQANPIAIEALLVLAQVQRRSASSDTLSDAPDALSDAVAISLLRAAIQAGPDNALVANELGYQLLKQGLLEEAWWALDLSFRLQPTRTAGINLAETLRQRGDLNAARAIMRQLETLPAAAPRRPQVYALSPQQFAALSQRTAPPEGMQSIVAPARSTAPTPAIQELQPTPVVPAQPAEPRGKVARVADAVTQLWK